MSLNPITLNKILSSVNPSVDTTRPSAEIPEGGEFGRVLESEIQGVPVIGENTLPSESPSEPVLSGGLQPSVAGLDAETLIQLLNSIKEGSNPPEEKDIDLKSESQIGLTAGNMAISNPIGGEISPTLSTQFQSLADRIRSAGQDYANAMFNQIRRPDSKFSPIQGGLGQVEMSPEFSSIRSFMSALDEPSLKEMARMISSRTEENNDDVLKLLARMISKTGSESDLAQLEGILKDAKLEVNFEKGTIKDLAVLERDSNGSKILVTDVLDQLNTMVAMASDGPSESTGPSVNESAVEPDLMASENPKVEVPKFEPLSKAPDHSLGEKVVQMNPESLSGAALTEPLKADAGETSGQPSSHFEEAKPEHVTESLTDRSLSPTPAGTTTPSQESSRFADALSSVVPERAVNLDQRISHIENQRSIINSVQWLAKDGGGTMNIQMSPVELGTLSLKVEQKGQELFLHVHAERPEVAQMIRKDLSQIVSGLEDKGLVISKLEVTQGSSFGQMSGADGRTSRDSNADLSQSGRERQNQLWERQQREFHENRSQQGRPFDMMDMVA